MNIFELAAVLTLDKSKYDQGLNDAESKGSKFGSGLANGAKVAVGAITAVGTAATAITKSFLSAAGQTAAYGDNIDKMSQKMGVSAQKYQEWDFILQHSGSSMETMKASMKTLASAAMTGSDAFEKLGISQAELANMSQEELFERVIAGLQGVTDTTERTYLAGQLLGRGATELGPLLNMTAEETEAMRQQVHDLGGVMSDEAVKAAAQYQDSLQNMQTALTGLKNNMMSEFLPSISTMMDGLAAVFSGDKETGLNLLSKGIDDFVQHMSEAVNEIIPIATELLVTLGQAIIENLPVLLDSAVQVIMTLTQGIIEQLPLLMEVAVQIIESLLNGLINAIPTLIPAAIEAITTIVSTLIDHLSEIVDAGLKILLALAEGILNALPQLIAKLPQIITAILNFFTQNLSKIIRAGVQLLTALVQALPEIISTIVAALPQIIQALVDFFVNNINQIVQAGVQLLTALIQNLPTIIKTIVAALPQIIDAICNTLTENLPIIIQAGVELFVALIQNLPEIIATICQAAPKIIEGLAQAFLNLTSNVWEIGKNIVKGIWEGIKNATTWLWEKLKGWVNDALGFLGNLLGIHSPSTVMRDRIGKMMGLGVAEGITDSIGDVEKASSELLGAIPDVEGKDFSVNVRRNLSDSYSGSMDLVVAKINEIMGQFQQTIILEMDEREFGRAVRGYV